MFPHIEDTYYENNRLKSKDVFRPDLTIHDLKHYTTIYFSRRDGNKRVVLKCSKVIEILSSESIEDLVLYTLDDSCDIRRFACEKIKELEKK